MGGGTVTLQYAPKVGDLFAESRNYVERASATIPGAVNSNIRLAGFPFPLCFERGQGAYLFDLDGNRFIDYALGMGPAVLGHAPPVVCDAVANSLSRGQMLGGQHRQELLLAERIKRLVPNAERVRVGMTGSEAVQAAIRVSRAFTGKRKFVKFEGQYHGWFDNVLLSYAPPGDQAALDSTDRSRPHLETDGQAESVTGDAIVLPWNDTAAVRSALGAHGDEVAAIVTEPAMCNTGAIAPAPGYLESLRDMASSHNVVLIFDEVITGFRLALGGGQEKFGVSADLATFAKAMGAGFPVSALTGRGEIMDLFGTGKVNHSGTYNANIPSVAAAIASLDLLGAEKGKAIREIDRRGETLMEGLRRSAAKRKSNLRVQGFGACFSTFFSDLAKVTDYRSYRRTDLNKQAKFLEHMVVAGIRPTSRGTWFISAAHSDDDIEDTVAAADNALGAIEKY
ncbi:MAG: aspartate aminotransferase family protein [Albidovulum sp.]|nr:aspartate aminotransferase family protein [Albidovulum sp.]